MKGASLIAPFGLRMPENLKEKIAERAKRNGRSMNAEIVQILLDVIDDENRAQEEADLQSQFMSNRKTLPPSYQEALESFDSRVSELIESATKAAMAQAGLELSRKIEEIERKKST